MENDFDKFKKHTHNGIDSLKINASNIDVKGNFKNFSNGRLENILDEIDKVIDKKFELNIENLNDNYLLKKENNGIFSSNLKEDEICLKDHKHSEYLEKKKVLKEDNLIVSDKRNIIKESEININDIVLKNDIDKKVDRFEVKSNNIVIGGGNNELCDSNVNINDICKKNHKHDEYEVKVSGKVDSIILKSEDGLKSSEIKISDIVLKTDKIKKEVDGENGDIIIKKGDDIVSSFVNINSISKIGHVHNFSEIKGSDIFLEHLKKELRIIVKEVILEIFKNLN